MSMTLADSLRLLGNIGNGMRLRGEDALTNEVAVGLRSLSLEGKLKAVWFHVPNETFIKGAHGILDVKKKHALGLINGAPDFVIAGEGKAVFIELKTPTGRQSDNQKVFEKWCAAKSVPYNICRSWGDVRSVLDTEGLIDSK